MQQIVDHPRGKRLNLSPLRYPGGKAKLTQFFADQIRKRNLTDGVYVEPYAGGAGAAINLLLSGQINRIAINDLDPAVYAFWHSAVHSSDSMRRLLRENIPTIGEWHRQKAIFQNGGQHDPIELGFATLFLNRTNRSGVLNAGPIGGMDQTGNYLIDARFNIETLDERLRLLGLYKRRIRVSRLDGQDVIREFATEPKALIYADPPYFNKAGTLYLNSFNEADHESLAQTLNHYSAANWILTYDDVPEVHALYKDRYRERFSLSYSAYRVVKATEVMVYADSLKPE